MKKKKAKDRWVDPDYLKMCLRMTPRERLQALSELNAFLQKAMPEQSKRIWEKLQKKGY